MKKIFVFMFLAVLAGLFVPAEVSAGLTYGNGYYTNLCDSGTAATFYNCDPGCDPTTGSCKSENQGVVKWVCTGKWNQCLESESQWSNFEQVDNISCGYTVQLSLFDKKCRREDGTWDNSCRLLGYMVWYSGECYQGSQQPGNVRPTLAITPFVTSNPTPTGVSKIGSILTVSPSPKPTSTPKPTVTPTLQPVPGICGVKCKQAIDCKAGFACVSGTCRNLACPADKSCFCKTGGDASSSAVTKKAPDTGPEVWLGMGAMVLLGIAGWKVRLAARKVW